MQSHNMAAGLRTMVSYQLRPLSGSLREWPVILAVRGVVWEVLEPLGASLAPLPLREWRGTLEVGGVVRVVLGSIGASPAPSTLRPPLCPLRFTLRGPAMPAGLAAWGTGPGVWGLFRGRTAPCNLLRSAVSQGLSGEGPNLYSNPVALTAGLSDCALDGIARNFPKSSDLRTKKTFTPSHTWTGPGGGAISPPDASPGAWLWGPSFSVP